MVSADDGQQLGDERGDGDAADGSCADHCLCVLPQASGLRPNSRPPHLQHQQQQPVGRRPRGAAEGVVFVRLRGVAASRRVFPLGKYI